MNSLTSRLFRKSAKFDNFKRKFRCWCCKIKQQVLVSPNLCISPRRTRKLLVVIPFRQYWRSTNQRSHRNSELKSLQWYHVSIIENRKKSLYQKNDVCQLLQTTVVAGEIPILLGPWGLQGKRSRWPWVQWNSSRALALAVAGCCTVRSFAMESGALWNLRSKSQIYGHWVGLIWLLGFLSFLSDCGGFESEILELTLGIFGLVFRGKIVYTGNNGFHTYTKFSYGYSLC